MIPLLMRYGPMISAQRPRSCQAFADYAASHRSRASRMHPAPGKLRSASAPILTAIGTDADDHVLQVAQRIATTRAAALVCLHVEEGARTDVPRNRCEIEHGNAPE